MAFGVAPAALLQSAHRVPITKNRVCHSDHVNQMKKYQIVVNDAPLSQQWISSVRQPSAGMLDLTYYTIQTILGKDIIDTPQPQHTCAS